MPSTSPNSNPHTSTAARSWGPLDAPLAVIALHGRTQDPEFIGELYARIGLDDVRWEAPAAHGNSWYSRRFMDPELLLDEELRWALDAVGEVVARLETAGYQRHRIALLGFSQGACLLSHWALLHPGRLSGLVLFTGGHIGPQGFSPDVKGGFEGTPVLISGPQDDDWVPLSRMRETEMLLRESGARVTAHYMPTGEHTVTEEEIALARSLLQAALASGRTEPGHD